MYDNERHPASWGPHTTALMALKVGQEYTIPGTTTAAAWNYIRVAKRGTSKCFAGRTLTTGARIKRTE